MSFLVSFSVRSHCRLIYPGQFVYHACVNHTYIHTYKPTYVRTYVLPIACRPVVRSKVRVRCLSVEERTTYLSPSPHTSPSQVKGHSLTCVECTL